MFRKCFAKMQRWSRSKIAGLQGFCKWISECSFGSIRLGNGPASCSRHTFATRRWQTSRPSASAGICLPCIEPRLTATVPFKGLRSESGNAGSSFMHSLIHSFIHSFIRSFVHSFIQSINPSINFSINQSFSHSINQSINQSLNHSIIQSFNHSFIQSFIHSLIHWAGAGKGTPGGGARIISIIARGGAPI